MLHSLELTKKGVKLFVCNKAFVFCKFENNLKNLKELLKYIKAFNLFIIRNNEGFFQKVRKVYFFFIYQLIKLMLRTKND